MPGIAETERRCGLRALGALVAVYCGSNDPAVAALRRARGGHRGVGPGAGGARRAAAPQSPEDHCDLRNGDVDIPPAGRRMMDATPTIDPIGYESIKALAAVSGRPANT